MTFCAQYGNPLSFYGNIEYGVWLPTPVVAKDYGAWPYDEPADSVMLTNHDHVEVRAPFDAAVNIAIIKRLKAELENEEDLLIREKIREKIAKARQEKIAAFQLAARIEEEESTFILLN